MVLSDKFRSLIDLLTQGTRASKIQWTADNNLDYLGAELPNGSVELVQHPSAEGYNLLVRNATGQLLDQTGYLSQRASPELADLAREVRETVLKSSEGLESIISGLRAKVTQP